MAIEVGFPIVWYGDTIIPQFNLILSFVPRYSSRHLNLCLKKFENV